MPTLEEMINQIEVSPRTDQEEPGKRTIWQQIKGEWPPLLPPPLPLTLEKVWQYVLLEDPTPPSAEDLATGAAEEDKRYPECQNAMYRRAHPDWLERDVALYTELSRKPKAALPGDGAVSQRRW